MHLNIQVAKSPISIQFPGRNTHLMDAQQMLTLIDPFTGYPFFPLVRLFFSFKTFCLSSLELFLDSLSLNMWLFTEYKNSLLPQDIYLFVHLCLSIYFYNVFINVYLENTSLHLHSIYCKLQNHYVK